jgi:hypothetical protein
MLPSTSSPSCSALSNTTAVRSTGWVSTRTQIALAACACGGATAFLYAVDPSRHAVYPQCLLYNATGIYCAGCGATRAMYALLHGRVLEALHDNALFVATLPLLLYVIGTYALAAWQANAWPQVHVDTGKLTRRSIAIVLLLIGFMLLRNLPGAPFAWLRPQ